MITLLSSYIINNDFTDDITKKKYYKIFKNKK